MKAQEGLTFGFVIQADLESLVEACFALEPQASDRLPLFYGQAIIHFLRGENDLLAEKIATIPREFADHDEASPLETACDLRALIRSRVLDTAMLEQASATLNALPSNSPWRGEIAMLIATAYTLFDDYARALKLFEAAAHSLARSGFLKKSLRAQMNVLVCESHIHPSKNLFPRYHDLYRQALKRDRRETIVATTCLLNISRDYKQVGANLAALKYCNRALLLFERQMGELNYFLALVHRAEILLALGRVTEAQVDIESAKLAPFPEIKAALSKIQMPVENEKKLSALEERLISLLSRGPRDRVELVDEIYGERLDHETKQNRFKSLIGTFRKKFPDMIVYEQSRYRLANELLVKTGKQP